MKKILLLVIIFSSLVLVFFRQKPQTCKNCNVIFLYVDTLRADKLPCWGYKQNTTPNLCKFAEKSVVFKNSYSQSSWTLLSNMSIITSLLPSQHKVRRANLDSLNESIITLPQSFQKNGYDTVFIGPLDHYHLPMDKGVGKGFREKILYESLDDWYQGIEILEKNQTKKIPTFLYLHTYDVHDSWRILTSTKYFHPDRFNQIVWESAKNYLEEYRDPSGTNTGTDYQKLYQGLKNAKNLTQAKIVFDQVPIDVRTEILTLCLLQEVDTSDKNMMRYLEEVYAKTLTDFDEKLGKFLDTLEQRGILKNSTVVLTSDHGDSFGEHGEFNHANNLYNSETYVPLIYHFPNVKPGTRFELTQSIDIYPTLCGLAGIKCPKNLTGKNFTASMFADTTDWQNTWLTSEFGDNSELKAIRSHRWKLYIDEKKQTRELYDLLLDPKEQKNLSEKYPGLVEHLQKVLYFIELTQKP